MIRWTGLVGFLASLLLNTFAIDDARLQAVEASVQIQEQPPQIRLVWPAPEYPATRYTISKRVANSGSFLTDVATLDGSATSWTDSNVTAGTRYEYRTIKNMDNGFLGHSYLMAGIRAPMLEDTGVVLLVVVSDIAGSISNELEQFRKDLIAENWEVQRQDVSSGASPTDIRNMIKGVYSSTGGRLKQVILIGHVAVPYSGNIFPDGHENHKGAWPADGFYGDMDGTWTDSTVNTQTAERQENWNVPGDGKFDQGQYPATLKLAVGRIDFYLMTCYANKANSRSEIDLTRQYLTKDHQFRSAQWNVARRGLVLDNFGLRDTNGVSATAWMNFAGFFGASANSKMDLNTYFPRLTSESALWTWTAGGGSYYYCSGVGTSDDYALNDINVVFSLTLGSYFGDWNNESNWTKAALGSGKVLVSIYSGIPRDFFHPMALGGNIGESFLLTENNGFRDEYLPDTQGTHEVHQALLGDPTLRMFPRAGVSSLSGSGGAGVATITWNNPSGAVGAHVYRSASADGPFLRITNDPWTSNSFIDSVQAGTYAYLVRPVYLEETGSGSFYNLGQGNIVSGVTVAQSQQQPPSDPPIISISRTAVDKIAIQILAARGFPVTLEQANGITGWSTLTTDESIQGEPLRYEMTIDSSLMRFFRAHY